MRAVAGYGSSRLLDKKFVSVTRRFNNTAFWARFHCGGIGDKTPDLD